MSMKNFDDEDDEDGDMEDDYTDLVIRDMYEVLTTSRNPWPSNYTSEKKIAFLDKMLKHLKGFEMFELCAGIQKIKGDIKNERTTKN